MPNQTPKLSPRRFRRALLASALALALGTALPAAALPPDLRAALEKAEYVYIASTRKDGTLSQKAEIWFMFEDGVVYVGTRPSSWRVKRIRWGRPQAKIWVGNPNGPSFQATGKVVDDPKLQQRMLEVFAEKYPGGWPRHEEGFREGFKNGSRVLVAYTPTP